MTTILITGLSDGIGAALAAHYAASGARVLGIGRRPFPAALAGLVQPEDYCRTDLARPEAALIVREFLRMRSVERLNLLIHNAALGWYGAAAEQPATSIDDLLAANVNAPIALTHALLPLLRKVHGTAAFVSSVHSVLPTPDFAVYTATKAALDGFARNLRIELRGDVDVLLLWPGPTRTGMHAKSGMPAASIHPARQMAVEVAAERMARAIARRQSATLRRGDGLLRRLAKHFESPIDAALAAQRRRAA